MDLPMAGAQAPRSQATPEGGLDPGLKQEFDALVEGHDLVLFMKGSPDAPRCGFSARAAQVLQATGRPFQSVDVFAQEDPFAYVRALARWADFPTLPQVWVKGELIGGSDIALEMYESGELAKMLGEAKQA